MRTGRRTVSGWLLAAALLLHVPWPGSDKICLKALPFPPFPSSAACERDCCDHAALTASALLDLPAMPAGDDCCIACATDTWFKCETRSDPRMGLPPVALGVVATHLLVRATGAGCVNDARPPGGSALAHLDTVILRL